MSVPFAIRDLTDEQRAWVQAIGDPTVLTGIEVGRLMALHDRTAAGSSDRMLLDSVLRPAEEHQSKLAEERRAEEAAKPAAPVVQRTPEQIREAFETGRAEARRQRGERTAGPPLGGLRPLGS